MVCLHGQSKNTGQTLIWSHLTRNSWLNTYISSSNAKLNIFFWIHNFCPWKYSRGLNPKKAAEKTPGLLEIPGNRRFCRSGHCSKHGWRHVARFFRRGGDVGICRCSKCLQKGSEVSSSFGIAFYSVPDVTLKFLRIFFMPAFFLAIFVFWWRQFDAFH